ncbi:MAG: lysophospholipid acyltransferase family protein [Candidatus Methylomirabilia bacterium]
MNPHDPDLIFSLGSVRKVLPGLPARSLHPLVAGTIERLLALPELAACYRELRGTADGVAFACRFLDRLGISWRASAEDLERIPATGPAIVVCNHPFGVVEGVVLTAALGGRRGDLRILANHVLHRIPELQELILPVDVFGGVAAARANAASYRQARTWLGAGGMVVVFPAGEVAYLRPERWLVTDPPWQRGVARLVRGSGAAVVPVYVPGANGKIFQGAGLLHPGLRTALLPRELLNKRGREIELRVGPSVEAAALERLQNDEQVVESLRLRTYALADRRRDAVALEVGGVRPRAKRLPPVAPAAPRGVLAAEIAALPVGQLLVSSGAHEVWCAHSRQIPEVLREIGRLREITFRLVGEGTGRALDLDRFDASYRHLVLWDRAAGAVAGAYRVGEVDRIIAASGPGGLYTNTLFAYEPAFFRQLGPALELGRSFVAPEYQKSYGALLLLWRGIGRFIGANPHYRHLFGPVSISDSYLPISRELMVNFLQAAHRSRELEPFVRPRTPIGIQRRKHWDARLAGSPGGDLEGLGALVADLEPDRKGVPILLRQYLKLDARVVAFNRDPRFSQVLDCLLVVDLRRSPDAQLARYLGKDGLVAYRAHHAAAGEERAFRIA